MVPGERSAFGFRGCLREEACCGPFRHFSLKKIDDLAPGGMIHLIALSLPVGLPLLRRSSNLLGQEREAVPGRRMA